MNVRMFNHKKPLVAAITLAVLSCSVPFMAANANPQEGPPKNHAAMEKRHDKMLEELGLSEEQKTQVKTIKKQGFENAKPVMEKVRAKRQAFDAYLKEPNATEAEAKAKSNEIGRLLQQLGEQRVSTTFQLKAVLTPEQFNKMMEKRQQFKARRHHKRDGGRQHKPQK